jgi:hypothetical protein
MRLSISRTAAHLRRRCASRRAADNDTISVF